MSRGALCVISLLLAVACCGSIPGCGSTEPVRQFEHGPSSAVAALFSSDGKLLAAAMEDGALRVWEVKSGRELARAQAPAPLAPRGYDLDGIRFSPDSSRVAFAAGEGDAYLWSWREGTNPQRVMTLQSPVEQLVFSRDGEILSAISGGLPPAAPVRTKPTTSPTMLLPMHRRSTHLKSGEIVADVLDDHCGTISVALSEDGTRAATTCLWTDDGRPARSIVPSEALRTTVTVRALPSGDPLASIEQAGHVSLQLSPDGRYLLAGRMVWDTQSGRLLREVPINARTFADDGRRVLVLNQGTGVPWELLAATSWLRPVRIDLESGRRLTGKRMAFGHFSKRPAIPVWPAFSPDRRYFVDYNLNLWRLPL